MLDRDSVASADNSTVVGDTLATTLESLDGSVNYCEWIFSMARPYLEAPVLEVGAGSGTFTGRFASLGAVTAVEPAKAFVVQLCDRYADDRRVTVVPGVVEDVAATPHFGSAVMLNVLEHIDDDAATLRAVRDRILPGGTLVLWVPAFEMLFSRFDEMLGHHRRYRKEPLRALVEANGFSVLDARYVNVVGWFGWLIVARILGRLPNAPGVVSLADKWLVPIIRAVESSIRVPFGQSVFLVARRPLNDD